MCSNARSSATAGQDTQATVPGGGLADHDPFQEEPHRTGLFPRGLLVGAGVVAGIVLDDEIVREALDPHEVVPLAADDLFAAVELRGDLAEDGLLVALERDVALDLAIG